MSDDWIPHDGGPCPVPPDTWVTTRHANNTESDYATAGFWSFGNFDWWQDDGMDGDGVIVAYRIVKSS